MLLFVFQSVCLAACLFTSVQPVVGVVVVVVVVEMCISNTMIEIVKWLLLLLLLSHGSIQLQTTLEQLNFQTPLHAELARVAAAATPRIM